MVTDLLTAGKLDTPGLISHRFPFAQAAQAHELLDRRQEVVVKVVLEY